MLLAALGTAVLADAPGSNPEAPNWMVERLVERQEQTALRYDEAHGVGVSCTGLTHRAALILAANC